MSQGQWEYKKMMQGSELQCWQSLHIAYGGKLKRIVVESAGLPFYTSSGGFKL